MTDIRDFVNLIESLLPGSIIAGVCLLVAYLSRSGNTTRKRVSFAELLFWAFLVFVSSAIFYPILRAAEPPRQGRSCLSNVKQLNLGLLMYSQDYDDRFPPASQWGDLLWPYTKTREIFKCPRATSPYSYAFNKKLNLLPQKNVKDDKVTVMLFEANATSINAFGGKGMLVPEPRHNDVNSFGFVDGHARSVPRDAMLKWQP